MESITVNGLVLGETRLNDTKKYIRILTDTLGKISIIVHGASGVKSKFLAAVKPFSYSSFTLTSKGSSYTLKEAELKLSFFKVSSDVRSLALSSYIISVAEYVSNEDDSSGELLPLTLNSLYAVSEKKRPCEIIKSVYELKCAALLGFSPSLIACCSCKRDITAVKSFIKLYDGNAICADCKAKGEKSTDVSGYMKKAAYPDYDVLLELTAPVISAMRYVIISDIKKVFSFNLPESELSRFSQICEKFLYAHIEREFPALKIYKSLTM